MGMNEGFGQCRGKVNAVSRRKSALIFLLLFLTLLILSPWATAPSPRIATLPGPSPEASALPSSPAKEAAAEPVRLRAAVALSEEEFRFLELRNEREAGRYPDILVELERVDPETAYDAFRGASRLGESADILLMENEWIEEFAVSGYLLPTDGAFTGDALSEQFDALSAPLKWNDLHWGVPRDFDPYVLVWSLPVLRTLSEDDDPQPPRTLEQWAQLAAASGENPEAAVSWLAMAAGEPYAMLSWMQSAAGERTDRLWANPKPSNVSNPWVGTPLGQALELLDRERRGIAFAASAREAAQWLAAGKTAAAMLPYSEAVRLTQAGSGGSGYRLDLSAWKLPFTWPRGRSFAISSRTEAPEAAARWLAAMTDAQAQEENAEEFGKLPVYRSLYREGLARAALFGGNTAAFPYQAPADFGPELPARMERLGELWTEWADGGLNVAGWLERWPQTLADFELNR